ncbi:sortase domain-bontaining protein [Streptomyces sp. NPDC058612]|uniref:sortase domain-containing protein n=1 Tax=Streptomyces sp. NPDC058612 TaxID=3346555 RepID=UPI00364D70EA
MTATSAPPVDQRPAAAASRTPQEPPRAAGRRTRDRSAGAGLRATGAALAILGALLLCFVAEVGPLGQVRHERDRRVGYAELRDQLANATVSVGPAAPGKPLALLTVPQLGIREVVREGTGADVLAAGPGHRRDTVLPGQPGTSILMGRQAGYGGPFEHVGELRRGETFTVTTGQGEHTYKVLGVRRAGDPRPARPSADAGRLVLMTADGTPYMPAGVLQVDAELVSPVQESGGRGAQRLPADELPMAGQASAWFPLLLWSQALLLAAAALAWSRVRWGRGPTWLVGLPVLTALALATADQAALLLPNLL